MASVPRFEAVIQAVDKVSGPTAEIIGQLKKLKTSLGTDFANPWAQQTERVARSGALHQVGQQISNVGRHLHGLGALGFAAFGAEAEAADEHVEHLGQNLEKTGKHAHTAGEEIKKSAHPQIYDVLSGHVHILRTRFGNLNAGIGEVGHSMTELLPMLGGLGSIASIGGLAEMMEHVTEQQSALMNTANAIGITTKQLMALNLASEHADVPVQEMQRSMERFNAVMGAAKGGASKKVAAEMAHLGIAMKDAHGHALKLDVLMPKLMDAFKHTADQQTRSRMAMQLFGRAGVELLPFLDEGAEGWRRYNEESSKIDYDPTRKEQAGLKKLHASWIDLRHSVDSLQTAIGSRLAPVLGPIVDQFKTWVANNRDWIATKIVDAVKGLVAALKTVHIKAIVEDFGSLAKHAIDLAGAIGPMPTIIGAVTLALGAPLLGALTGAIRDIKELTTWAYHAAYAIGTTLVKAMKASGEAMKGMDASFHATTIGRAAAIAFELADLAHKKIAVHLNPTQKKMAAAWHLKPGEKLTSAQMAQIGNVPMAGLNSGPSFHPLRMLDSKAAPSLIQSAGGEFGGAGLAGGGGTTRVTVEFKNAPPGTRVKTASSGSAPAARVAVGFAQPAFGY